MALLSCAVQYNARIENNYYLKYKGLYLKYQKCTKDSESDVLTAFYTDEEENEVYKKVMEFAYAYAYYRDYECLISDYLQNDVLDFYSMAKYPGGFVVNRKLYMEKKEYPWDLPPITLISSKKQSDLLQLYTRANSNQDPIFKCLFFFHTIVYPSKNDNTVIPTYINNYLAENIIPQHLKYLLTYLLENSAFGDIKNNDFGNHVKNIRNSIAHIIRNSQDDANLRLDNIEQNRYLGSLARVLKEIAKYKLDTEYDFCKLADKSIISAYDPVNYK